MTHAKFLVAALVISGLASPSALAVLLDRGAGLVYDDILDVTWLRDASYAKTSGYDADGRMSWAQAVAWAGDLTYYDSVRGVTWDDWRLPSASPVNGQSWDHRVSFNGATDIGFNVSYPGIPDSLQDPPGPYAGSTASELAHLYYVSLGNRARFTTQGVLRGGQAGRDWGLAHTGPFVNLQANWYWSGTPDPSSPQYVWVFNNDGGFQGSNYVAPTGGFYAIAVRNGDVAALPMEPPPTQTPILPSLALLASALSALGWAFGRPGTRNRSSR